MSTDTPDLAPAIPINASLHLESVSTTSWADNSDLLPAVTLILLSTSAMPTACNTAVLHSEHPSAPPFGWLHHHTHCLHHSCHHGLRQQKVKDPLNSLHIPTTHTSITAQSPPVSPYQNSLIIMCHHPADIGPGKPVEGIMSQSQHQQLPHSHLTFRDFHWIGLEILVSLSWVRFLGSQVGLELVLGRCPVSGNEDATIFLMEAHGVGGPGQACPHVVTCR